jgi:hypothetical protein
MAASSKVDCVLLGCRQPVIDEREQIIIRPNRPSAAAKSFDQSSPSTDVLNEE